MSNEPTTPQSAIKSHGTPLVGESEARLQRLAANMAAMIYQYVLHADGSDALTYVTPRCRDIYELEPEALLQDVGQVWAMIHAEDVKRVRNENCNSAKQLERLDIEFRLLPPSGCLRWVRVVAQPELQPNGDVVWDGLVLDITAEKKAEAALAESEHRYATLTEAAPVGIFWFDAQGQCTYVNPRWSELTGRPATAAMGMGWLQTVHPDDRDQLMQTWHHWAQTWKPGQAYQHEARVLRPDGSIRWFYVLVVPELDDQGDLAGYVGSLTDISDRKIAEEALQDSEARWQFALEGAGEGVWDWNAKTNMVFFSQQWKRMLGYEADEIGNTLSEWDSRVHPDDKAQCYADLNNHFQGKTPFYLNEHRVRCKDGSYKWILDRGKVIERSAEGQPLRVIGTHTDITARKLAEQKIREQAALLDIASDAIFVRDLDHRILYWNQGAERLYGWPAEEIMGQTVPEILHLNPDKVEEIMQTLLEQGNWQGELRKVTKGGQSVIVAGRWTLVRDEANQPKFILSVDTDVTEKKQLEAQFYRAQRLESLGTLASGIAHDLNNILTPILAIAKLMRRQPQTLDAPMQDMMRILENSATRGAEMVQQILTFARGTDGERIPVPIVPLLQEVVTVMQSTLPASIEIHAILPDQVTWAVLADPTHLHQVLINLCVNARDAMPKGGVLTLAVDQVFIDQAFVHKNLDAQVGQYVVVTVTDTGVGIPDDIRDRIFDPFFTTKDSGQGTGLGLSTVLGIVKNYGGFLQVSSQVGQGTEFKIYLPEISDD